MSRDRGSILFSLWGDDDWRDLTIAAQHLYMQLLSSPSLSYAGVADWRPGKLALASDSDAAERYDAALELHAALFVVIDDSTEEILVRSFLRHDGLLQKPNIVIAMHKAYAAVASAQLRGVIIHELKRLKNEFPGWKAWDHPSCADAMSKMMKARAIDPKTLLVPVGNGSGNPSTPVGSNPSGNPSIKNASLHLPLQLPLPPSNEGETPPSKCSLHEGMDSPPKCGACADQRRIHQAWMKRNHPTVSGIITDPDCTKHPGRPARGCDRCAEDMAAAS